MKRLVFSVVGGVVIPFLYMVIVGPLTTYIQDDHVKQLMGYPVRWPVIILQGLLPLGSFPFRDEDELFLLLLIVLCDVLLYSILTYILLWRFGNSRLEWSGYHLSHRDLFNGANGDGQENRETH